jgi:hypothetical protein
MFEIKDQQNTTNSKLSNFLQFYTIFMENTYNFFTEALDLLYSEKENGETIETLLETQRKIIIQEKSKF